MSNSQQATGDFRARRGAPSRGRALSRLAAAAACCLFVAAAARAQASPPAPADSQAPLRGDWAPELLYGIWDSPNSQAADELYRAAFAAGHSIIPQLQAALVDDRTAEFAAQSLAFMGGSEAFQILAKLVSDPRNLALRRFYYGALGEADTPEATRVLLEAIGHSDSEPDRSVTEAAILALTVRSDASLVAGLRQAEKPVSDPVIRDDIENAITVISARARYLASPQGRSNGVSLERAVRTYFIPALEPSLTEPAGKAPGSAAGRAPRAPAERLPPVEVKIQHLTFSPDGSRALAHVTFEDPSAVAEYDLVLQKQLGDWTLASVWLGPEREKASSGP